MLGIGEFFKKIQRVRTREVLIRTTIQEAIKKHTGIEVPLDSMSFSGDTVVLKFANNSFKSVLFIKKTAIVEEINRSQSLKKVTDIR